MLQGRLNDTAIALYRILAAANIKHGVFGVFAIGTMGGNRESKDIDCIASVTKPEIIAVLDGKEGFRYVDQSRDDYVMFFWSDKPDRSQAVTVEIFVEKFQGTILAASVRLRAINTNVANDADVS